MKKLLKALILMGIVVGSLISVKLILEILDTKSKKRYMTVFEEI